MPKRSCYAATLTGEKCKNPIGPGARDFKDGKRVVTFCALHAKSCLDSSDYKAKCPDELWYDNLEDFKKDIAKIDIMDLIELRKLYVECKEARKKKVDECFQALTDVPHMGAINKMNNAIIEIDKLLKF